MPLLRMRVVKLAYTKTDLMLVDCCTKLVNGDQLYRQISYAIGQRFYPQKSTRHYELLDLHQYTFTRPSVSQVLPSVLCQQKNEDAADTVAPTT